MVWFWFMLGVAIILVLGSALLLLRTAKAPHLPGSVQSKPDDDRENDGW